MGETMAEKSQPIRKYIDPHVHCRDWEESGKTTIKDVMQLARSQGVVAIFDMPNTRPAVTTKAMVEMRLWTAESQNSSEGYYTYIGVTSDMNQVRKAARVAMKNPKVVGIKMYAGTSTGDLSVINPDDQRRVYKTLKEEKYTGVITVHCEEESLKRPDLWVPSNPATWNLAKPPEMEIVGVGNQIRFVKETGFQGHLHIAHASLPETVEMVWNARAFIKTSCEATPHHLTLSTDDMQTPEGMMYKVNPPIRDRNSMLRLQRYLRDGKIDMIATDHAPHLPKEKTYDPSAQPGSYMSGIRSLNNYASFINGLSEKGFPLVGDAFPEELITRITYSNIKEVFPKVKE